jgi:methionyl-tRNA formyltransferase
MSQEINKVLFIGTKRLGLNSLKTIHQLYPEKLAGVLTIEEPNDQRGIYSEFQSYCLENNIKLYCAHNRKNSEELILEIKPEFCLVVGWYWIISIDVVKSVPKGFVGIHNSILPKYRGGAPLVWSIIHEEKEVGYSLFSFTEGMDDGEIWNIYRKKLEPDDDIKSVLLNFEDSVSGFLKETYPKIIRNEIKPVPQNDNEASFCALRNEHDGLINWNRSSREIYNFIRAQSQPYPGAFTYYKGLKLIIWKARIVEGIYYGTPGQVAKRTNESIHIICGDSKAIEIFDIQYLGSTILSSQAVKSLNDRFDNGFLTSEQFYNLLKKEDVKEIFKKFLKE